MDFLEDHSFKCLFPLLDLKKIFCSVKKLLSSKILQKSLSHLKQNFSKNGSNIQPQMAFLNSNQKAIITAKVKLVVDNYTS